MKKLIRLPFLLVFLCSCLGGENANDALNAKFGQGFSGGTASQRNKVIEIVKSDESQMTATVMDMGESLTLKAVVTDPSGKVIEAAPCYWTIQGADYSDSDLSANNNVSTTVFTPSNIGNPVIRAVYTGSRTDILVA